MATELPMEEIRLSALVSRRSELPLITTVLSRRDRAPMRNGADSRLSTVR